MLIPFYLFTTTNDGTGIRILFISSNAGNYSSNTYHESPPFGQWGSNII